MTLTEIHKRLRPAFPSKWDAETDNLAKSELKSMIAEFGESRTDRAVTQFIRNEQFFSIAKLRDYIPPADAVTALFDPNCKTCDGTSWENVKYIRGGKPQSGVRRCSVCWKGSVTQ